MVWDSRRNLKKGRPPRREAPAGARVAPLPAPPPRQVDVIAKLHPKQEEFFNAAMSGRYQFLAYGGAIRGGKSVAVILILFILMRIYPRSRWAIVRKDLPTLRRNTLPVIEKFRPRSFIGDINQATWTYTASNGSQLILFPESIKGDPDLNRWRGLDVNGFVLEESNELDERSATKAVERAGAWVIPATDAERRAQDVARAEGRSESEIVALGPRQPPPLIFYTFNPADNWVRRDFYEPWKKRELAAPYYYQPATVFDNPSNPPAYIANLKHLPPEEYRRFVLGDWGSIADPFQLIPYDYIHRAQDVPFIDGPEREALDVARFGDSHSVWARKRGNKLATLHGEQQTDLAYLTQVTAKRIREDALNADEYRIDAVGLGAGVYDNLHAMGLPVLGFIAGGAPVVRYVEGAENNAVSILGFNNLRSQAWWEFREKLRTEQLRLDPADFEPKVWRRLVQDLTSVRYRYVRDKVIGVESKDDIMKRLGRSTDYGDAAMMVEFDFPEPSVEAVLPPSVSRVTYR